MAIDPWIRLATAQKMIKASKLLDVFPLAGEILIFSVGQILSIPTYTTTQSSSRMGPPCSELFASSSPPDVIDKTAFSMMVPELRSKLKAASTSSYQVAIVGIETHICVTQTALDLLADGHKVYVLADGVSSCHEGERGIALDRVSDDFLLDNYHFEYATEGPQRVTASAYKTYLVKYSTSLKRKC